VTWNRFAFDFWSQFAKSINYLIEIVLVKSLQLTLYTQVRLYNVINYKELMQLVGMIMHSVQVIW
jgi:hypothetical protein